MERQLKGIALILFGILLCLAEGALSQVIITGFPSFTFGLCGAGVGITGLVLVFRQQGG